VRNADNPYRPSEYGTTLGTGKALISRNELEDMRRRTLLATVAVTAGGGCLSIGEPSSEASTPKLAGVTVQNHDYESYNIQFSFVKDGTEVSNTETEVPARDGPSLTGTALECSWKTDVGGYVVRSRLATQDNWHSIDLANYDDDEIRLKLLVGETDRGETPNLEYWTTSTGEGRCIPPSETTGDDPSIARSTP
jgi:hypothetical protein